MFSYPYLIKKVLLLKQILESDILKGLYTLRFPESEYPLFRGCLVLKNKNENNSTWENAFYQNK